MRIMPGGALEQESSSIYVGQKLDEHRGAFLVEYPMDKGAVADNGWDAMEALWEVSHCAIPHGIQICETRLSAVTFTACLLKAMPECETRRAPSSDD